MVCSIIAIGAAVALLAWVNEMAVDLKLAVEEGKITPPSIGTSAHAHAHAHCHCHAHAHGHTHAHTTRPPPRPRMPSLFYIASGQI